MCKTFNRKLSLAVLLFFVAAIIGCIVTLFVVIFLNRNNSEQANLNAIENQEKFFLKSFYNNKREYDESFEGVSFGFAVQGEMLGGITSHHFLAKQFIAEFFGGLSSDLVEEVYVVGPDHFYFIDNEDVFAYTNDSDWDTPYGNMMSAKDTIRKAVEYSGIVNSRSIFLTEHSIYTIVPFAKRALPNAKIIPIVLSSNKGYESFFELGKQFRNLNEKRKILIVSSDFSHGGDFFQTEQNDQKSLEVLENLSLGNLDDVVCDCRNCLAFALGFLGEDVFLNNFRSKNSTDFGGEANNITSYFNAYFVENKEAQKTSVRRNDGGQVY